MREPFLGYKEIMKIGYIQFYNQSDDEKHFFSFYKCLIYSVLVLVSVSVSVLVLVVILWELSWLYLIIKSMADTNQLIYSIIR